MMRLILDAKLIACTSSLFPERRGKCLNLETATAIIRASRSGALVYCTPTITCPARDLQEYDWSFLDLLESLGDTSPYAFLANTSRTQSTKEVIACVERSLAAFESFKPLIHHQEKPIIKLEVLRERGKNKNLCSDDATVVKATYAILSRYQLEVIPLLSPDPASIAACADAGVKMVRILSGRIGNCAGLDDQPQLKQAIASAAVPVILEGGIATPEHVMCAFRLGAAVVLLNSAFRKSPDPIALARELRVAVDSWNPVSAEGPP